MAGALAKIKRVLPQALLAIIQPRELVNLLQALMEMAFHLSETAGLGCEP